MKTHLHKLPEEFIITSDEDMVLKDICYQTNYERTLHNLILLENETQVRFANMKEGSFTKLKVIAQQDQITFSEDIPKEKLREIGWFDVEQWAWDNPCLSRKEVYTLFNEVFKNRRIEGAYQISASKEVYIFNRELRTLARQKAQELLSDRIFTLEDVKEVIHKSREQYWDTDNKGFSVNTEGDWSFKFSEEQLIQSISQLKSWEVEIEKEISNALYHNGNMVFPSMESSAEYKSKFTNGKIKILRIL